MGLDQQGVRKMSHTEGKLHYQEESDVYTHIIRDEKNKYVASAPQGCGGTNEADARRLVACWNEHDGLVHDNARLYESLNAEMRARLEAEKERDEALKALNDVLLYAEHRTCSHDETHRGGAIWEICDDCGKKWADDEGGKPEWTEPPELAKARAILAKHQKETE